MTKRALLILVLVLVACTPSERTIVSPTETLPVSSALDQELDGAILDGVLQALASGDYGYVDRFLLIQNGRVVIDERYEHDYEAINAGRDPMPHPYNHYLEKDAWGVTGYGRRAVPQGRGLGKDRISGP